MNFEFTHKTSATFSFLYEKQAYGTLVLVALVATYLTKRYTNTKPFHINLKWVVD